MGDFFYFLLIYQMKIILDFLQMYIYGGSPGLFKGVVP